MAVDLRNFEFNSNAKMDNVVWVFEDSFSSSTPDYTLVDTTIANPFTFKPLCFGNFSLDGGITWQDIDFVSSQGQGQLVSRNDNTISIYISHATYTISIKVRIYAFTPASVGNLNFTKPTPISNFYINTENKYDNIVASGEANISASNSIQTVYAHNLGYVPRVMLWQETSTGIYKAHTATVGDTDFNAPIVTNSELDWKTTSNIKVHYRIYGGQNG